MNGFEEPFGGKGCVWLLPKNPVAFVGPAEFVALMLSNSFSSSSQLPTCADRCD